jgi:hypothetical protein
MSHDLDLSTGTHAIAYVGSTPWHRFGEKLEQNQSIETWLRAARLEWELTRLPVQYLVPGGLRTMRERFVLMRRTSSLGCFWRLPSGPTEGNSRVLPGSGSDMRLPSRNCRCAE